MRGGAACWIEISHDRRFLFVVNPASASVSSYSIAAGGAVVESGTNGVTGFIVNGGTLTPLTAAAVPASATPSGIVVN